MHQRIDRALVRALIYQAQEYYPHSRRMRRDWVKAKLTVSGPKVPVGCGAGQTRAARSLSEAEAHRRVCL